MKPRVLLPLLALAAPPGSAALTSNPENSPQLIDGVCSATSGRTDSCEVELDVPASCAGSPSSCPIVFFLHGSGGTNNGFSRNSEVHGRGVIGVYPQVSLLDPGQGKKTS